jgi:hypothetical protein
MLQGCKFELWSDCQALEALLLRQQKVPKLQRLVLAVQEFTFKFVYVKGSKHRLPDALSRREYEKTMHAELDDAVQYGILLDSHKDESDSDGAVEIARDDSTHTLGDESIHAGPSFENGHLVSGVHTEGIASSVFATTRRKAKQRKAKAKAKVTHPVVGRRVSKRLKQKVLPTDDSISVDKGPDTAEQKVLPPDDSMAVDKGPAKIKQQVLSPSISKDDIDTLKGLPFAKTDIDNGWQDDIEQRLPRLKVINKKFKETFTYQDVQTKVAEIHEALHKDLSEG